MIIQTNKRNEFLYLIHMKEQMIRLLPYNRLQVTSDKIRTDIYQISIPIVFLVTHQIRETYLST